jgi:putative flippase GtrA
MEEPGMPAGWRDTAFKLMRFALVGGSATLLYALFAIGLHQLWALPVLVGHVLAYLLAVPLSYLGQRHFAFSYRGPQLPALGRFLVTAGLAFAVSTCVVYVGDEVFHWHYLVAIGITMILVPTVSFIAMLLWVFIDRDPAGHSAG